MIFNCQEILSDIRALTPAERKNLITRLVGETEVADYITLNMGSKSSCSFCGDSNILKFGKVKGKQRYKCKACNRTFNIFTRTWLARNHKIELVNDFVRLLNQKKSITEILRTLNINRNTAYSWRRKYYLSH
jgi:transposase-like protein